MDNCTLQFRLNVDSQHLLQLKCIRNIGSKQTLRYPLFSLAASCHILRQTFPNQTLRSWIAKNDLSGCRFRLQRSHCRGLFLAFNPLRDLNDTLYLIRSLSPFLHPQQHCFAQLIEECRCPSSLQMAKRVLSMSTRTALCSHRNSQAPTSQNGVLRRVSLSRGTAATTNCT